MKNQLRFILPLLLLPLLWACAQSEPQPNGSSAEQEKLLAEADASAMAEEVKALTAEPQLTLHRNDSGEIQTIMMEEYLKGVVAAEIGKQFPLEALKAQAIVARTMTLALLNYEGGTHEAHGTDVSDEHTEFQAYDETAITEDITQAVAATRGMVLVSEGKYAYTLFSSVSEGTTASIEEGFPTLADKAGDYIQPVATDGLKNAPEKYRSWEVRLPVSSVKRIMQMDAQTPLESIEITQRGPSQRVMEISANNGAYTVSGVDFRQGAGFDHLYSTIIHEMKLEGEELIITGAGWGHGCGMEQWGAYTMAEEGADAMAILSHYYPGAEWIKLYE
ncbi:MAG: SpoIID/LytB domain-containing protein [Syntrophomonadaceae bacterium]|nr:SpoIID/LytB domain-containing protein [Syntrophomonadaceae bacterium]